MANEDSFEKGLGQGCGLVFGVLLAIGIVVLCSCACCGGLPACSRCMTLRNSNSRNSAVVPLAFDALRKTLHRLVL
jgi:hypothetical protein